MCNLYVCEYNMNALFTMCAIHIVYVRINLLHGGFNVCLVEALSRVS